MERQGCAVIPPFAAARNQMRDTIGNADRFLRFSGSIAAKYRTAEGDIWKRFTLVFRLQMHGPRQMRNRTGIDRTVIRLRRALFSYAQLKSRTVEVRNESAHWKLWHSAGKQVLARQNLSTVSRRTAVSSGRINEVRFWLDGRFDGKSWNLVLTRLVDCQGFLKIQLIKAYQTPIGRHAFEKKSLVGIETCNDERATAGFGVLKNIRYGLNGKRLSVYRRLLGGYRLSENDRQFGRYSLLQNHQSLGIYPLIYNYQVVRTGHPVTQFRLSGKYGRTEIDMITEDFASVNREKGIGLFAGIENHRWIKAFLTRMTSNKMGHAVSDGAGHAVPDRAGHAVMPAFFTYKYSLVSTRGSQYSWNSNNPSWLGLIGQAEKHWFKSFQKSERIQTFLIAQTTRKNSTVKRKITCFDVHENGKYSIKSGKKIESLTFYHMTSLNSELLFRKHMKLFGGITDTVPSGAACPTLQNIVILNGNRKNFVEKDVKSASFFIRKKAVIQMMNPPVSTFSLKTEIRFLNRKRQGIVLPANNEAISVPYSEKKVQLLITLFLRREVVIHSVQPVMKIHQSPVLIKDTQIKSSFSGADNRRVFIGTIFNKVLWHNRMVHQDRIEDSFYRIINKQLGKDNERTVIKRAVGLPINPRLGLYLPVLNKETGVIIRKNLSYKAVIGNSVQTKTKYGKIYHAITAYSALFSPLPRCREKVTVTSKTLLKTVKRLFSRFRSVEFGMIMQKNRKAYLVLSGTAYPVLSGTACPVLSGIITARRNRKKAQAESVRSDRIFMQKNPVMKKIQRPIFFSILKRDIHLLYRRQQTAAKIYGLPKAIQTSTFENSLAGVDSRKVTVISVFRSSSLQGLRKKLPFKRYWQVLKNEIDRSAQKQIFYRVTEENFGQVFKKNGKEYELGEKHILRFTAHKEFRGIESASLRAVESFFSKIHSVGLGIYKNRNMKISRRAEYSASLRRTSPAFFRTAHRALSATVQPILSGTACPALSGTARLTLYGVLPFAQIDTINIFRDVRKQRYLHKIKNIPVQKNFWSQKNILNRRSIQALKDIWNLINAWKQDNPWRQETTYIQGKNQNRRKNREQGNNRTSIEIWNYVTGWTHEWILKQRRTQKQGYSGCSENFRSLFEYRSRASAQSRDDRCRPQELLGRNYFKNLEFIKKSDPSGQIRCIPKPQLFSYCNNFVKISKFQPQVSSADFDRIIHLSSELFIKKNERQQHSVQVPQRSPVSRLFTARTASTREDTVNKADVVNAEVLFAETMHERLNPIADQAHPSYHPNPLLMVHVMKDRNIKKNSGGRKEADSPDPVSLSASGTGSQQVLTETLSRLDDFSVIQEHENNEERIQLETLQKQVNEQVLQIRELYKTQEALTKQLDRQNSHLDMRLLFQFEEELQMEQLQLGLDMA